jgi:hypothetical protein
MKTTSDKKDVMALSVYRLSDVSVYCLISNDLYRLVTLKVLIGTRFKILDKNDSISG